MYPGSAPQILPMRKTPGVPEGITSVKEEGILVRPLQEVEEMSIIVDLQRRVWGPSETQGHAAVGFAFEEQQGSYILEPYED